METQVLSKPTSIAGRSIAQTNEERCIPLISPEKFSILAQNLRVFFESKGFQEVHTQNRLSIMAACEDPYTLATYNYCGQVWPLPQTGQMWLEYELLTRPEVPGFFCLSTSYRNEPHPVAGRHHRIFPMFEFEMHGDMDALIQMEKELLNFLGFNLKHDYLEGDYVDVAKSFKTKYIEREEEEKIGEELSPVFFLKNFPDYTNPFWNMKREEENYNISKKVDVLLHGMETIGSAERSCNPEEMKKGFETIEDGRYAQKLYDLFGQERVDEEMEDFLSHHFTTRSGGGIGMTRLIRAMELSGLLLRAKKNTTPFFATKL